MDESTPPSHDAWIDPLGSNREAVGQIVHRIVDLALDWRASAATRSPAPPPPYTPPGHLLPQRPRPVAEILEELGEILAHSANTTHPRYLAHMGAVSTTMSPVGDFLSSAINNNLIGLELSPALSLLEHELTRRLAQPFGLGDRAAGVITTGGSLSNLHALAVARNDRMSSTAAAPGAVAAGVILASEAAHASVKKSAMLLGLGNDGALPVGTKPDGGMDPADLERVHRTALAEGRRPFCLVATAGTTVTGSLDPLSELADFAAQKDLWYHVDAAWGGGLAFSDRLRARLDGVERADSLTFCPQKLFLVGLSSSVVLFRDFDHMTRRFRVAFPYVHEDEGFVNRSEIGVQGSRPAEVLKLWLTLQHAGTATLVGAIERWVVLAESLAAEVERRTHLQLAVPARAGIVCFRCTPLDLVPAQWDGATEALHRRLREHAGIELSIVRERDVKWLRAVFSNPFTDSSVLESILREADAVPSTTDSRRD